MSDKLNNYDVRMYETIDEISPCPYCGLDRILIHHYNEGYEDPNDYTVEHLDEKAAVTAGCFDMYYAFGSPEDAIRKANMRKGED